MHPHFEKVPTPGGFAFHVTVRSDPAFPFNWHYHPEYELTLIVDSVGQRLVGNGIADYGPGDLVLLGPDLPHSWRSVGGPKKHRAVVIRFRKDFPGSAFFELEEMAPIARLLDRAANGLAFGHTLAGRRAARLMADLPSRGPQDRLLLLLSILCELSADRRAQSLSLGSVRPNFRPQSQKRVDLLCGYLEKHASENVDYPAIVRLAGMEQASLCRFFKRATGRTMTAYVNELRVAAATELLTTSELNVIEIGCRVGFYNYSNFNRQFKRLKGLTPAAMRKQFRSAECTLAR